MIYQFIVSARQCAEQSPRRGKARDLQIRQLEESAGRQREFSVEGGGGRVLEHAAAVRKMRALAILAGCIGFGYYDDTRADVEGRQEEVEVEMEMDARYIQ